MEGLSVEGKCLESMRDGARRDVSARTRWPPQPPHERRKVFITLHYYSSLHSLSDYRAEAEAGYAVIVDPAHTLSLKLGVEDRYNSNPGDTKKKNDVPYFATIVYNF